MKIVKIAAVLASSFLTVLLILIFKVENPDVTLYEQTVEVLMNQEGLTSMKEIEERFPLLIDIKSTMDQITQMNEFVLSKTHGSPPVRYKYTLYASTEP